MKKSIRVYIVALALFASGMGYLVWSGLDVGATYHINVADALALPENAGPVRVFGTVQPQNFERSPNAVGVRFLLEDQNNPKATITVVYPGAIPEGFKPGIELYAYGLYKPRQRVIEANELMTKCPSKYKKDNRS